MLLYIIDWLFRIYINIKLNFIELYRYLFKKEDFIIVKALLYNNLYDYKVITNEFCNNRIRQKYICNKVITEIFEKYKSNDLKEDRINQRIKIEYLFKNKMYIMFIQNNQHKKDDYIRGLLRHNSNQELFEKQIIRYPFFSERIIELYKKNHIFPHFVNKKVKPYNLFAIDCKDIESIYVNDINYTKQLMPYLEKIHSPLNDFGLLYMCPVRISWMLYENGLSIEEFKSIKIKYTNYFLDEENYDLVEHYITKYDYNDYLISDIIIKNLK